MVYISIFSVSAATAATTSFYQYYYYIKHILMLETCHCTQHIQRL